MIERVIGLKDLGSDLKSEEEVGSHTIIGKDLSFPFMNINIALPQLYLLLEQSNPAAIYQTIPLKSAQRNNINFCENCDKFLYWAPSDRSVIRNICAATRGMAM